MATVTPAEVRFRLGMSSTELSDDTLNSVSFIPAGEDWFYDQSGEEIGDLVDRELRLAKVAVIAYVAKKVLSQAPADAFTGGPVEITPAKAEEKVAIMKELSKEIDDVLRALGLDATGSFFAIATTGNLKCRHLS